MLINWWEIVFYSCCAVAFIQILFYLILFRRVGFYEVPQKDQFREHAVSVVVCARDEAHNLSRNLPGILVQSYRSTHEVIVVNDNSTDETKYLLEGMHKQFRQLHIIELKQEAKLIPGKKFPLSIGIKTAKHEILLLTDADCVPASENWIQKMQDAYEDGIEIVLGHGAYEKRKGLLNTLIRFDTFHTALQYFSYALAGIPYMGVGRNLSYRKQVFFRNKGFAAHNNIPGGDDDLFINAVATKTNTAIVLDKESFTLSQPQTSWAGWMRQKNRHYSTGKYYRPLHRFLLGIYALTYFLFYPLLVLSAIYYSWLFSLGIYVLRLLIQGIIWYKAMLKLDEKNLWPWFWLLDLWMFFYYIIFMPAVWKKPKKNWK